MKNPNEFYSQEEKEEMADELRDRDGSALSAHTPGPWTLSPQHGFVRHDGIHGPNICAMDVFGGPAEEAFANARLISAAPDGLALAEHILALETDPYLQGHPEWESFLNEAKALVNKVRGVR